MEKKVPVSTHAKKIRTDSTGASFSSSSPSCSSTATDSTSSTTDPVGTAAPLSTMTSTDDCLDEVVLDSQGKTKPSTTELCGVCFKPYSYPDYCDWIQCACGQWTHEDCVDEIVLDEQGKERFCPACAVNPRRMRSEGYGSQFVCLSVCYRANCYKLRLQG